MLPWRGQGSTVLLKKMGAFEGSLFVGADGVGGVDTTCRSKFVLGGKRGETVPELVLKGWW